MRGAKFRGWIATDSTYERVYYRDLLGLSMKTQVFGPESFVAPALVVAMHCYKVDQTDLES